MAVLTARLVGVFVVALVTAMAIVGCGGSSGSSNANEPEASKAFLSPKGKNTIPKFGEEASSDEREAASAVLEENLEARAAGEWAKQCASMSVAAIKKVEGAAAYRNIPKGCVSALKTQGEPKSETQSVRENTMSGPIDALRVKGEKGYALYHGTKGKDYAMPMEKENGEWKVGSVVTTELSG